MAMLIAVSCLSPVIIKTLIPASVSISMVSGTPSWSLSSMAVMPSKFNSVSISSAQEAILLSLSSIDAAASWYF